MRIEIDPNIIDRCQNHAIHTGKSRVRRHYQLYDYADEKKAAWAKLGECLERLLSGAVAPAELQKRLTAKQLLAASNNRRPVGLRLLDACARV